MDYKPLLTALVSVFSKSKAALPDGFKSSEGIVVSSVIGAALLRAPTLFEAVAAAGPDRLLGTALAALAEVLLYVGVGAVASHYALNRTRVKVSKNESNAAIIASGGAVSEVPSILSTEGEDEDGDNGRLGFRTRSK